jgi:hypothetical protein
MQRELSLMPLLLRHHLCPAEQALRSMPGEGLMLFGVQAVQ